MAGRRGGRRWNLELRIGSLGLYSLFALVRSSYLKLCECFVHTNPPPNLGVISIGASCSLKSVPPNVILRFLQLDRLLRNLLCYFLVLKKSVGNFLRKSIYY